MSDQEARELLMIAFEYSFMHEDWVSPLEEVLDGLSASQASRRPRTDEKSIWEIVLHMAIWNENIVERVKTRTKARPIEGAWAALPTITDETAWDAAKTRLERSLKAVQELIAESPIEDIRAAPYGFGDLICRPIHVAYHIGQISKLRSLIQSSEAD